MRNPFDPLYKIGIEAIFIFNVERDGPVRTVFHTAAAAGAGRTDQSLSVDESHLGKKTPFHTFTTPFAFAGVHANRQAGEPLIGALQGSPSVFHIGPVKTVCIVAVADEHEVVKSCLKTGRVNPDMGKIGNQSCFGGTIHVMKRFLGCDHSSMTGMDSPNGRPQGHTTDHWRRRRHVIVSPADAFVKDKDVIHIRQKSLDNAAGHNDMVRTLDVNIEGNRTDFVIWPHEKRINKPPEHGKIAEFFPGFDDGPREFDGLDDKVSSGAVSLWGAVRLLM
jgi:hypothetical protein